MRFHSIARGFAYLAPLALVLSACKDSPTADDTGEPYAIVSNTSALFLAPNSNFTVVASVIDRFNGRLAQELTLTSATATAIQIDSTRYLPELAETRFYDKLAAGQTAPAQIFLSAGSVQDTVNVVTVSAGTASGAAALIFRSPVDLFTAETEIEVDGGAGTILSRNARELAVLLPFGASGTVTYEFSGLNGANALSGSTVAVGVPTNEDGEPNDDAASARDYTVGSTVYGSVSEDDVDDFYELVVTEAGSYEFELDWNDDDADVDLLLYRSNGSFASVAGATSNHPEHFTVTLQPGTYYIDVNLYSAGANDYVTYNLHVVRH